MNFLYYVFTYWNANIIELKIIDCAICYYSTYCILIFSRIISTYLFDYDLTNYYTYFTLKFSKDIFCFVNEPV